MTTHTEMLKGVLEGCILAIIDRQETYGYAITKQLNDLGFTEVVEGSVYTVLVRLEKNHLVEVEKKASVKGPPRKFYHLNAEGKTQLQDFWQKWEFLSHKVNLLKETKS